MSLALVVAAVVVAAGLLAWKIAAVWFRYRGAALVTCPENQRPTGVEVDAAHAAATVFHPELRLKTCSRWPEKQDCGRECLKQIEASPEGCLVRSILAQWYAGRSCVYCGKAFDEIQWAERKPGLLGQGEALLDWTTLRAEELPATLATAKPVCFSCYSATSFAKHNPDLVINRGRPA